MACRNIEKADAARSRIVGKIVFIKAFFVPNVNVFLPPANEVEER